jgi:hypothetical protein
MRTTLYGLVGSVILVCAACGGGSSDTSTNTTPTASATDTAPPPSASAATSAAPSGSAATVTPPVPDYVLGISAAKFTPDKGATIKAIEVKDDGTVNVGPHAAYKITKAELDDTTGTAMLKVAKDGTVTQGDGKAFGKFDDADLLAIDGGAAISVDDKGLLKVLDKPATPSKTIKGKFDKVDAKGRRSLVLTIAIERMLSLVKH